MTQFTLDREKKIRERLRWFVGFRSTLHLAGVEMSGYVRELLDAWHSSNEQNDNLYLAVQMSAKEQDRLREALAKYGNHLEGCKFLCRDDLECTCGFEGFVPYNVQQGKLL